MRGWSAVMIEGDPEKYKELLPKHDLYKQIDNSMGQKSEQAALARYLLKSAGYSPDSLNFYFDKGVNFARSTGTNYKYSPGAKSDWKGYATGGIVSSRFAQKKFSMGTDTVPAMLTPGEFVMNKFAVQSNGIEKMKAINNGSSVGDAVYNYSISVNVRSESNPDEIARTVIAQIKSVDAQKMRGVRT